MKKVPVIILSEHNGFIKALKKLIQEKSFEVFVAKQVEELVEYDLLNNPRGIIFIDGQLIDPFVVHTFRELSKKQYLGKSSLILWAPYSREMMKAALAIGCKEMIGEPIEDYIVSSLLKKYTRNEAEIKYIDR